MTEKEIMLSAVNSMGYLILRNFKLETDNILKDAFIESVQEESYCFLGLLESALADHEVLPKIRDALKYELREGKYDFDAFIFWLYGLSGGQLSLVTDFYCALINEIRAECGMSQDLKNLGCPRCDGYKNICDKSKNLLLAIQVKDRAQPWEYGEAYEAYETSRNNLAEAIAMQEYRRDLDKHPTTDREPQLKAIIEAANKCLPLIRAYLVTTNSSNESEWSQAYLQLEQAVAALGRVEK